ncbi:MAG: hypothetical protein JWN15_3288 [Firmicutes bacterium]|nr:hypothetical protein [Bacillota bacterium]
MSFSIEYARHLILSYGALGPLAVIGLYVVHSFIPFPAQVLTFAVGAVYGPVWGTLLVWAGVVAGALAAFGAARLGGRRLAKRFVPAGRLEQFDVWVEQHGVGALLFGRVIPFFPVALMNFAAGLAHVSWQSFAWTTAVGTLPMIIVEVIAADQLRHGNPVGLWLMGALLMLGGLIWLLQRRRIA